MLAIETEQLTKRYAGRPVVEEVSLRVPIGCVYGFLGPNGSGKTTTMKLLLGLTRADRGSVRLVGHDLLRSRRAALANVGAFVESPSIYDHLSGWSNLDLTRRLLDLDIAEVDRVLDVIDMRYAAKSRAGTYSLGMKQRLALARALLGSPKLLLLDEPTNGLDPDGIMAMRMLIKDLPNRINGTVFVSSHLLFEIEQIADHVGVMRRGRLIAQDEIFKLLGDEVTIELTVDSAEAGAALLRGRGMDAEVSERGTVHVRCAKTEGVSQAAIANRLLVEGSFSVSIIKPRTRTLEEFYRREIECSSSKEQRAT